MCVTLSTAVPRPGKKNARPPRRSSPGSSPLRGEHRVDLAGLRLVLLVQVLHDDLLAAVDGPLRHPAGQAGLPGERRVAAGVDVPVGPDAHVPVPGARSTAVTRPSAQRHVAEHRAGDDLDAQRAHGPLQPAAERDLVVEDGRRVAAGEVQVAGRPELAENVVEDPVRQLGVFGGVAEYPAEKPDQRVRPSARRLAAASRPAPGAAQAGGLDRRRRARDPGSDDAHIGADLVMSPDGRSCHRVQPNSVSACGMNAPGLTSRKAREPATAVIRRHRNKQKLLLKRINRVYALETDLIRRNRPPP